MEVFFYLRGFRDEEKRKKGEDENTWNIPERPNKSPDLPYNSNTNSHRCGLFLIAINSISDQDSSNDLVSESGDCQTYERGHIPLPRW